MNSVRHFMLATLVAALACGSPSSAQDVNPQVIMKTNMGDMKIELFAKEAPISSKNFLEYAQSGYFEGTIFHRVIDGFMVQGGGFTKDMKKKPTREAIKNESKNGLTNDKYTLAMARTNVPDSATSQFFINTTDNDFLNRNRAQDGVGYAVFGKVVEGKEVVDKIGKVKTTSKAGMGDVPVEPVIITAVEVVDAKNK